MAKIETALEEEISNLTPEVIVQRWTAALAPNPDLMASMLWMMPNFAKKQRFCYITW